MRMGGYFTTTYLFLLFATIPIGLIFGVICQWKTYTAYELLGDRVRRLGFQWFAFQFQLGSFARGMPGYVDYMDSLPSDLKTRILALRRQMQQSLSALALWIVFVFLFGALSALIRRHDL